MHLFQYSNEYQEFWLPELRSLLPSYKFKNFEMHGPFMKCFMTDEELRLFSNRSVLIKNSYSFIAQGDTWSEFLTNFSNSPDSVLKLDDVHWSCKMSAFNIKLSQEQQNEKIKKLSFANFPIFFGPVSINNPDVEFGLLEFYNNREKEPGKIYLGQLLKTGRKYLINKKYSLKNRIFIGRTSMDPLLSFLMSNFASVSPSQLVIDPFVGTGGILLAAAHDGAHVIGAELDFTLLKGRGKSTRVNKTWRERCESNAANFRQYQLEDRLIDIVAADFHNSPLIMEHIKFDCIITDPPYGVRESLKKKADKRKDDAEVVNPYKIYQLLLEYAEKMLKKGGRLVFFVPDHDLKDMRDVLSNTTLKLKEKCEQKLGGYSRFLVLYVNE